MIRKGIDIQKVIVKEKYRQEFENRINELTQRYLRIKFKKNEDLTQHVRKRANLALE